MTLTKFSQIYIYIPVLLTTKEIKTLVVLILWFVWRHTGNHTDQAWEWKEALIDTGSFKIGLRYFPRYFWVQMHQGSWKSHCFKQNNEVIVKRFYLGKLSHASVFCLIKSSPWSLPHHKTFVAPLTVMKSGPSQHFVSKLAVFCTLLPLCCDESFTDVF